MTDSAWPERFGAHGRWILAFLALFLADSALAQFKITQPFTQVTAPGWTLSDSAYLTAPSLDPAGSGWLRLTDAVLDAKGTALYTGSHFAGAQPLVVQFSYVAWGGTGADGITLFLYDATQNMAGAAVGGGLGYCGGAGGYLAIGLDEYGNFSNPGDRCGAAGGGPGRIPESLVIRGPVGASNAYVAGTVVPGGIDNPNVTTRPAPKTVIMTLIPATVGFTLTVQFQSGSGQPFQTLLSNVSFPYPPPATLGVGFSAGTGSVSNIHEIQGQDVSSPADLVVSMAAPATVSQGHAIAYTVTVTNDGPVAVSVANSPTVTDTLPPGVTGITWTCAGSGGASCSPSGSGNLSDSMLTLPVNGEATA